MGLKPCFTSSVTYGQAFGQSVPPSATHGLRLAAPSLHLLQRLKAKEPEAEVAKVEEPEPWTAEYITRLPDNSFAYIEKGDPVERHYPLKDKDGKCDELCVRDALSAASQEAKGEGPAAEIAKKAMPAIVASAKKLKVAKFMENMDEVLAYHSVTKVGYEFGNELAAAEGASLTKEQIVEFLDLNKSDGDYVPVYDFQFSLLSFAEAHENYKKEKAFRQVFDVVDIFRNVVAATMINGDSTLDERMSKIEDSADEFLTVLRGAGEELDAARAEKVAKAAEAEPAKTEPAPAKPEKAEPVAPVAPAINANELKKQISESIATDLAKVVESAVQKAMEEPVEKLTKDMAEVAGRVSELEKEPVIPKNLQLRAHEKGGGASDVVVTDEETGETHTVEGLEKRLEEVTNALNAKKPVEDQRRNSLEIEGMKLARKIKIAKGEPTYEPNNSL